MFISGAFDPPMVMALPGAGHSNLQEIPRAVYSFPTDLWWVQRQLSRSARPILMAGLSPIAAIPVSTNYYPLSGSHNIGLHEHLGRKPGCHSPRPNCAGQNIQTHRVVSLPARCKAPGASPGTTALFSGKSRFLLTIARAEPSSLMKTPRR